MPDQAVDAIDLAGADTAEGRRVLAREIDEACRTTGFLRLRHPGLPAGLTERMHAVTRAYFARPPAEKGGHVYVPPHGNRGYAPMGGEALASTYGEEAALPDLFEAFTIGPVERPEDVYHQGPDAGRFFEPNLFPPAPAEFEAVWSEFYRACERLADDLMSLFALALELPEDFFRPLIDRHISAMRALHYPALAAPPPDGQYRIGPHSDFGSLTILLSDGTPGLQVVRDGRWQDVVLAPGELLVNIGDLMADWTGGRWTSTLHRVLPSAYERDRLTVTFFHHPNYDAVVTPLRPGAAVEQRSVTAGQYLADKLEALRFGAAS